MFSTRTDSTEEKPTNPAVTEKLQTISESLVILKTVFLILKLLEKKRVLCGLLAT